LRLLFEPGPPRREVVSDLLSGQRSDGGWGYPSSPLSSINETLWRLTQAGELGVDAAYPSIMAAIGFLASKQNPDGSWQEDPRLAAASPPWATPGRPEATVYLTASAGYSLAALAGTGLDRVRRASDYLLGMIGPDGRLPSFLHSHWLAAGLWWRTGRADLAEQVISYLATRLDRDSPANHLSWAAVTLLTAGYPPDAPFSRRVLDMLEARQAEDGHLDAEDGEAWFSHATWEALKALKLAGRLLC